MKLVFAIVQDKDAVKVTDELNIKGFSVTKLCSSGGFLKAGNTTLIIGVEKSRVDSVIEIIRKNSRTRRHEIDYSTINTCMKGALGAYHTQEAVSGINPVDDIDSPYPLEVIVGGATVFVVDVERFEKV